MPNRLVSEIPAGPPGAATIQAGQAWVESFSMPRKWLSVG